MKQDDAYQFFVRMKLRASGKAVAAKLGTVSGAEISKALVL
jgi:hypothetical protein